jgi:hypothetical protein
VETRRGVQGRLDRRGTRLERSTSSPPDVDEEHSMRRKSLFTAVLLAFGFAANNAAAQCIGFNDTVDDAFCPAVEWLKNRAITTGCPGGGFCPDSPVTRLAMAQFMYRLGKAFTPVVLHKEVYVTNDMQIAPSGTGVLLCQFDDEYTPTGFPRTARFYANVYAVPISPAAWLIGWWKYSTDNGTTWNNVPNATTQRDWAAGGSVLGFSVMAPPMDLDVGTNYRFALVGSAMGGPYTFDVFGCQIQVVVDGRNPQLSPLDE